MLAQIVNKTVRQYIFCIQVFNRDVVMGGGGETENIRLVQYY